VAGEGGCFHAGEQHRGRAALDFASAEWKKSGDFFRQSCEGGYADGCLFSAQAIEAPYGAVDASEGAAVPMMIGDGEVRTREQRLVKACSLGSAAGCKRLGDVLIGKAEDRSRAAYVKACRAGAAAAACEAARTHEVDFAERFRVACTHRQADQCTNLGNLLFATDPPRAMRLFASECELRGVADLAGGLGSFIRARQRQAAKGISLPDDAPRSPLPAGTLPVEAHATRVAGELALVEVERALSQHQDDLATCMATVPGENAVKVALRLIVDRSGDAWRAIITDGAPPAPAPGCIIAALEALSFSEPRGGIATVEMTLSRPAAPPSSGAP
jgi:hypothetical protein